MTANDEISAHTIGFAPWNLLKNTYLAFNISRTEYKIAAQQIIEIVYLWNLRRMADFPPFLWVSINVHGDIIPVLEVQARLGLPAHDHNGRTCIVVVNIDGQAVGLALSDLGGQEEHFICGMGKINNETKILLNIKKFLYW
jgi:purine-binding chemotaxis protein CheW